MIKFFRKIRQKLLQENRVSKYLLYAFGEIILVVIGILIALQINDWNEDRKNNNTEQKLLNALQMEFESNLKILEDNIQLNDSNINNSLLLGEYTNPTLSSFNEKEISLLMLGVFKDEPRFFPIQGTIEEIINSGKLSIISNSNLRKALSDWQSKVDNINRQEVYVVERRDIGHEFFIKEGNFRRHLNLISVGKNNITASKFANNDFAFLTKQEFESQLYLFVVASKNLKENFYLPLREDILQIIQLIKSEIK